MLLPPLCLLGLSLVTPGVAVFVSLLFDGNFTDLGCRLRLLRKHLRKSEQVEMLLPPLCLLGLSLVTPGNFTDLGCRLRLLRKHLRK
ncbi:hypothetical protein DY000_02005687 [Brassica cretica]|uniref:Uncharacterized protein n=1 Tax=Brassica cretica TaxID=69181 RepID=A0ABQ7BZB1_BRACR|nr:hypothetical protein DY000_02005687 [Brassica cretica]